MQRQRAHRARDVPKTGALTSGKYTFVVATSAYLPDGVNILLEKDP